MKLLLILVFAMIVTTAGVTYTEGIFKSAFQLSFFATVAVSLYLISTGMFKGP